MTTINIKALHQQAQHALNKKDDKHAHQLLLTILKSNPNFADAYFLLAMIASKYNNLIKSIQLIKQAHVLEPENNEYIAHLAKQYALNHQDVIALSYLHKLNKTINKNALTLDTIGVAYSKIGLHQEAIIYFKQAVKLSPNNATFQFNLGASLKFTGHFEEARTAYKNTIAISPNYYKAYNALSSLGNITPETNQLERLTHLYKQLTSPEDKLYISHALAREYEALGLYKQSFDALIPAKKEKLATLNYTLENDREMFKSIQSAFSQQHVCQQKKSHKSNNSDAIFVVGMPRTGTTLVERLISQHRDVTSAGELQNFGLLFKQMSKTSSNRVIDPETIAASQKIDFTLLGQEYINSTKALTANTVKFVDKMPLNVLYAGFIIKALPNCKIICLDRNPLDTVVSNFKQLFTINQSYYNYSYSLEWSAEFYLLFNQLMHFWQDKFPDNFLIVNYEKLVNSPSEEAQKIFKFCDLDWQEEYLNIHQNSSPVATASAVQVRQPINNNSVNQWRKFESYLDKVKTILANK